MPVTLHQRSFVGSDLPLLQHALAEWIRAAGPCGYYHPGDLRQWICAGLRGTLRHERVLVWHEGEVLAGMAICGLYDTVFHVFTSPALRGGEAELVMLRTAYATTRRLAREAGDITTDVFGCDHVRRALLPQLGFVQFRQWDDINERSLAEPVPEVVLPAGFHLRPATHGDDAGLAAARNDAFGDSWTPEQYRDEFMRASGYLPEHELVALAPDGRIAAFCLIHLDELNHVGQFEPVGTVHAFQRQGLARAVMCAGMRLMRRHGMQTARVEHDATNLPAAALYRSLGFVKRYETFGWRITAAT
jgi:ribosomal protein S18 acetylase RimI-like enzyme